MLKRDKARFRKMLPEVKELRTQARRGDIQAARDLCCLLPNSYRGKEAKRFYERWQAGRVSREVAWQVLHDVWIHDHTWLWGMEDDYGLDLSCSMFMDLGPGYRSLPAELQGKRKLTIWRGGTGQSARDVWDGISWTLNRGTACWFATQSATALQRDGYKPYVIRRRVPRSEILAYFGDRREEEVIVLLDNDAVVCDGGQGLPLDAVPTSEVMEDWHREGKVWKEQLQTC